MALRDREPMPPRMRFNRWKIWAIVALVVIAILWIASLKADAQSELPMFDIFDSDGAVDFATDQDITDELQWALDNRSENYYIVIPPGPSGGAASSARYQISDTIVIPKQHGGAIIFGGASVNSNVLGLHCELEWRGADGGTMFTYSSTDWRFYGHPHFYAGSPSAVSAGTPIAAVGWQTTKDGTYNAGRMTWEASTWHGFEDAAIKIGLTTAENSNDVNFWGDVYFKDACAAGMKVIGHQALQQEFRKLGADGNVPFLLDVYASGCIWAQSVYCNSTLLRLNSATRVGGDSAKSTGKNNGYFRFSNVKSDTQAGMITLVEFRDEIRADVVIDGGLQSGGDTATGGSLLKMMPRGVVTLRNYRCLGGGGTISGTGGLVIMDGCRRMSTTGTFADDVTGDVELFEPRSFDYNANLFPSADLDVGAVEDLIDSADLGDTAQLSVRRLFAEEYLRHLRPSSPAPAVFQFVSPVSHQAVEVPVNVSAIPATVGKTIADITGIRVMAKETAAVANAQAAFDEEYTDGDELTDAQTVGKFTLSLVEADFGVGKIEPGRYYRFVVALEFAGVEGWVETDSPTRVKFSEDLID